MVCVEAEAYACLRLRFPFNVSSAKCNHRLSVSGSVAEPGMKGISFIPFGKRLIWAIAVVLETVVGGVSLPVVAM